MIRVVLGLGLMLAAGWVQAAASSDATRSLFLDTLRAAQAGRLSSRADALAALKDYPLYDYLPAAELTHDLRSAPGAALDQRIGAFIAQHADLPPAQTLRRRWVASLAQRRRWALVLRHARDGDGTTSGCRVVHARIALGQNPRNAALGLWRVGHSQPSACDPVFAWLQAQGLLTPAEILGRARLALLEGQYGLVHYLEGRLPPSVAEQPARWLKVAVRPSRLISVKALDGDVAVYAFKRLALRDLDQAAGVLAPLVKRLALSADQRYQMRRYVALLYAQNHEPQALAWFARIDHTRMADDEHALGWEIRSALYQRRWPLVVDAVRALPARYASEGQWRYWLARALAETGHADQAKTIYTRLAGTRSYHGYLAADVLGVSYRLNARRLPGNAAARARVEARPSLVRSRELHALGMIYAANREWSEATRGLDDDAMAQAARIAFGWHWYARAIITLAKADYWDDLEIRYPVPYADAVARAARANDLDPAYVLAIIRTESLFQPDIRSPAGARGLMQLMPGTARHVAAAMGQSAPNTRLLTEPSINIAFGTHYLRQMLNRWQGNLVLATASYNAGPNKIADWLPARATPADIWIANIPYTETRKYVQRAMSHMTIFQDRLPAERIIPLDSRLATVKPAYQDAAGS